MCWFLPYNSMNQPQVYGESAIRLWAGNPEVRWELSTPSALWDLLPQGQEPRCVLCSPTQHRATCIVKDCSHLLLEWSNEQTLKLDTKISNHYQGLNFSVQESIILLNLPEWHLAIFSNSFCHLLLYLLSSISCLSEIFVLYLTEILKEI